MHRKSVVLCHQPSRAHHRMEQLYRIVLIIVMGILLQSCGGDKPASQETFTTGDDLIDRLSAQVEANPEDHQALYQRATAYYEKEEFELAINDLQTAMRVDSLIPAYYHLLADSYLDYYKSRDALDVMELAAERFPDRVPTLLKLSEYQLILQQNENSILTLNDILRNHPQNSEAFFMLGMNFRAMDILDKAINSFQTSVEINPENVDAWMILAELHERNGTRDVVRFYDNAIRVAPDNPRALHNKAFYLQNHEDIPGALDLYRQINLIDPQYTDAYLNAGILYMESDSLERAFEQINILVGIEPENPIAYYHRAIIHRAYGNLEAAKLDLENSLNLVADFPLAQQELEEVTLEMGTNDN